MGRTVKLPGPSKDQPNSYPFGTPYQAIYDDLTAKDTELYTRTGLLAMARRNLDIKRAPERWQNSTCALAALCRCSATPRTSSLHLRDRVAPCRRPELGRSGMGSDFGARELERLQNLSECVIRRWLQP